MGINERQPKWDLTGEKGNLIITFGLREAYKKENEKLIGALRQLDKTIPPLSKEKMAEGKRKFLEEAEKLAQELKTNSS